MTTIHVLDYLSAPQDHQPRGICVLFGDEQFLKRLALSEIRKQALGEKSEEPPTVHDCEERMPDWRDVADELSTQSLFGGGGPRLVLLEGADAFVSAHRDRLEDQLSICRRCLASSRARTGRIAGPASPGSRLGSLRCPISPTACAARR